jgi:thiamine biosynthesis lipoprotein
MADRSTRREFLQGKAAARALADFDVGVLGATAEPAGRLLRYARRAMACTFEVFIDAARYKNAAPAALAALDLVDQLEDQLSIFRPESEISRLNRDAAFDPVEVEPRLFDLLAEAIELYHETGGAFDITAGQLSRVWGFTRREGRLPTSEELDAARRRIGSHHLALDRAGGSVRFSRPGLEINLGSIGKGYALDRVAEQLAAEGIDDYLLHGGASSLLARGTSGTDDAWVVGLRNPLLPEVRVGQLRLANRALATSGSATQFFVHEGRHYGHILDPRTGWPAEGVLTATVLAPTAARADALATAFYVLGVDAAEQYCRNHPAVASVMICPGASEGSITIRTIGLDEGDWTLLVASEDEPASSASNPM